MRNPIAEIRTGLMRHFGLEPGEGLSSRLVQGGVASLAFKVVQRLLLLVTAVMLARLLGAEGYGVYAYALAIATLLGVPVQFGLPQLLVREVAKYQVRGEWGLVRGLLKRSNQAVLGLSIALALVVGAVGWWMADTLPSDRRAVLGWTLLLIPLVALGNLRSSALLGLRLVARGQLAERLLRPGLFVLGIVLALLLGVSFSPERAMALHVIAALVVFLIMAWLLRANLPGAMRETPPKFDDRVWLASTFTFALLAGGWIVHNHTDVLMLGLFAPAEDVGVYRVVVTGAQLVGFALQGLTAVLSPYAAHFWAAGETDRLQLMIRWSTGLTVAVAAPVALAFILFGDSILALVFGDPFARGHTALAILSVSQLLNIASGPAALLLTMSGHERVTARSFAWSIAANVVLNAALIPRFGMIGAATATASTFVAWRVVLWIQVRRRLGIDPSILYTLSGKPPRRASG